MSYRFEHHNGEHGFADLRDALDLIETGDLGEARRVLGSRGDLDVAIEAESLIGAGHVDRAVERLNVFLNPKWPSVDECADAYRKHMESAA